jgi:hypothetical protein
MPLMSADSWITGKKGSSLPFTDECEPIIPNESVFGELLRSAIALGRKKKWRRMEIRGGGRWLKDSPFSARYHGHALDLTIGAKRLFGGLDGAHRRGVKKAESEGVKIEFRRDAAAMREFYRLLIQTRQRHGVPPQPYRFFANVQKHIVDRGQGHIIIARKDHVAVAGAVFFHQPKCVIYKYGASDMNYQSLRANNLVMWSALERYSNEGYQLFDFGRTSLGNEGLRRFKSGWGSTQRTIDYFTYDFKHNAFTPSCDNSSGWQHQLFKRLPPILSRWIGTALYKHIA